MVKREVAFVREGVAGFYISLKYLMPKKKVINNEQFAYLRGCLVKKRGWCF